MENSYIERKRFIEMKGHLSLQYQSLQNVGNSNGHRSDPPTGDRLDYTGVVKRAFSL